MVSTVIHGDSGTFVGTLGITLFLGIMIWVLSIAGFITGIIGVAAKSAKKGFAIAGLAVNGGTLAILLLSMIR